MKNVWTKNTVKNRERENGVESMMLGEEKKQGIDNSHDMQGILNIKWRT